MADRIGVIQHGRLVQVGTPREIYEHPCNAYVAGRLGMPPINLIPAGILRTEAAPSGAHTVGARTEHLRISAANGHDPVAEVRWIEHLGDQNHVHLILAGQALVTLADPRQPLRAGDRVSLELADPLYFDASGKRLDINWR